LQKGEIFGVLRKGEIFGVFFGLSLNPPGPLCKRGGDILAFAKGRDILAFAKGRDIPAFAKGRDILAFAKGRDILAFAKGGGIPRLFSDRMPASFRKQQNIPPL
jgi:hypothetical protein